MYLISFRIWSFKKNCLRFPRDCTIYFKHHEKLQKIITVQQKHREHASIARRKVIQSRKVINRVNQGTV